MIRAALPRACLLLALAACGREEQPPVPAAATSHRFLTAPAEGFALHDTEVPDDVRVLCDGFNAVRAPAMHHDGTRFCFLGRRRRQSPWFLYTATLAGDMPAMVEVGVDERSAPAWLPDDSIVYSAVADDDGRALFVVSPGGGREKRITFSDTEAHDPCVLRDGRVLYAAGRTTPDGRRVPALFTVHPDGVGVLLFHGATPGTRYARPRQGPNGDVVFLAHDDTRGPRAWVVDWRAPSEPATALEVDPPVAVAEPDRAGSWLLLTGSGTLWRVAKGQAPAPGPTWRGLRDLCAADPRRRPQGHMSRVGPDGTPGRLLCVDATQGVSADAADAAGSVRLHARIKRPDARAHAWSELGRVPLSADGSFHASVPADTPLRLDVLSGGGAVLRSARTAFWVRPGETRGCVGCHDAPDATPPNRRPAAALADPVTPRPRTKEGS